MKKLIMTIAVLAAAYSHGATYRQASQAWVEMKIAQMESRILASVSQASSATNAAQAEAIINNSSEVAISSGYDIANTTLTTSIGVKTNGVPYYVIGTSTNPTLFPTGTALYLVNSGGNSYTNAGNTIILYEYPQEMDGNYIRASGGEYRQYDGGNIYYRYINGSGIMKDNFVIAVKYYK
jgi:hypothetical protein